MEFKTTSTKRRNAGFSIVEMIVGVAIGTIALTIVGTSWAMIMTGFSAIDNYTELEQDSRYTLDLLGRDIRQSQGLLTYSDDTFTLIDGDGDQIVYTYSSSQGVFSRTVDGVTEPLLSECEDFYVDIYQRNTISGTYDQYPTADVDTCKLIQITWKCSRLNLNGTDNTELVQSAKFVISKK